MTEHQVATETVADSPRPSDAPTPPPRPDRRERLGWLATGALTAVVAATWVPLLNAPMGDNHLGRVTGRYALHLRNLQEKGLIGSHFGADWAPYVSSPYAHHPPLRNLTDALFGALPGDHPYQLRIAPFLLALLAIPASVALLRGFGIAWVPTLLAVGTMVGTGYYWFYGQLRWDLGLILALSALIVQLRHRPTPPRWLVWAACAGGLLAGLGSWPTIAFAAVLGLWLLAARRLDRVTVAVGASMVFGVVLSLSYMFGIHGFDALADQTEMRTTGGSYTASQFVARQWEYFVSLLPVWYLALAPLALAAGLINRRTRLYMAVSVALTVGWVAVLNNGAYIHNYWAFLVLVPGLIGTGALLDAAFGALARLGQPKGALVRPAVATAAAGLLTVGFAALVASEEAQQHIYRPVDAGRLVAAHAPPASQQYAWSSRIGAPRWLAYYWDRQPRVATPEVLAEDANPTDLVLLRLDRLPGWLPGTAGQFAVAQEGQYALVPVADLLRVATSD